MAPSFSFTTARSSAAPSGWARATVTVKPFCRAWRQATGSPSPISPSLPTARRSRSIRKEIFMTAAVQLENVVKRYKRGKQSVEVLHKLDLDVPAGEFLALMGPSGSGKTTLLNLIGGRDLPDEGAIIVGEQRIDRLSNSQLARWRASHVGFVFQFYNLMPMLSAERNIELPLLLTSLSAGQRRAHVKTVLDIVGLADRARHKPSELSGGQQQRIG